MEQIVFEMKDEKNVWNNQIKENLLRILIKAEELEQVLLESKVLNMKLTKEYFEKYNIDLYAFEVKISYKNTEINIQKFELLNSVEWQRNNIEFLRNMLVNGKRIDEFSTKGRDFINFANIYGLHGDEYVFSENMYVAYEGLEMFLSCFEKLEEEYVYSLNKMPRRFKKIETEHPDDLPF
ncbi:hypothetical protein [Bacillus thuringiensis]|uniref:Uncharacterized protein n=1 Tax=Bacillus thuringiensis TaxID=1428 RepID=A0A9X6WJH2_BACTU|nr:hypothetical protein [Bacillus thuringiensis]PFJ32318.1 hypothetical protein COJ15_29040 [Bacillus thuringiensis]